MFPGIGWWGVVTRSLLGMIRPRFELVRVAVQSLRVYLVDMGISVGITPHSHVPWRCMDWCPSRQRWRCPARTHSIRTKTSCLGLLPFIYRYYRRHQNHDVRIQISSIAFLFSMSLCVWISKVRCRSSVCLLFHHFRKFSSLVFCCCDGTAEICHLLVESWIYPHDNRTDCCIFRRVSSINFIAAESWREACWVKKYQVVDCGQLHPHIPCLRACSKCAI